jgi:hypothetical protein
MSRSTLRFEIQFSLLGCNFLNSTFRMVNFGFIMEKEEAVAKMECCQMYVVLEKVESHRECKIGSWDLCLVGRERKLQN